MVLHFLVQALHVPIYIGTANGSTESDASSERPAAQRALRTPWKTGQIQ